MPGLRCKKRKHTPIVSRKQQKLFGAVAGGKATKAKSLSVTEAKRHLRESKGKKLPLKVKKKKLCRKRKH